MLLVETARLSWDPRAAINRSKCRTNKAEAQLQVPQIPGPDLNLEYAAAYTTS
jgi:hypothetical protein